MNILAGNYLRDRLNWTCILAVAVPSIVFLAHALAFRGWIVDDAAISFSYARNLAAGHGLVSQPGVPPVEGFSNFLWVVLIAPFFYFNVFDPVIVPKLLSGALVVLCFVVLCKAWESAAIGNQFVTLIALTLTASNTSFVTWSTSGLENPLYVLLLCLLMYCIFRSFARGVMTAAFAVVIGLVAGCIALTRPDGCMYFLVYPLLFSGVWICGRRRPHGRELIHLSIYTATFAVLFGCFLLFRITYFHDLLPNTFYAKVGDASSGIMSDPRQVIEHLFILKPLGLLSAVAGAHGNLLRPSFFEIAAYCAVVFAVAVATIRLFICRRSAREYAVLAVFAFWSALVCWLLPLNALGEYRFAMPFVLFFYAFASFSVQGLLEGLDIRTSRRSGLSLLILVLIASWAGHAFWSRSTAFAKAPTVPFQSVAADYGRRFDKYAAILQIKDASVLLPDMGGPLYYSKLRLYDLVGLCDKTIARTLGRDMPAFYHYVFDTIKPTFIHTHGLWALVAKLDDDPRFRRDYVPILEAPDKWVKKQTGKTIYSGDYVRKDAVARAPRLLEQLKQETKK